MFSRIEFDALCDSSEVEEFDALRAELVAAQRRLRAAEERIADFVENWKSECEFGEAVGT